MPGTGHSHRYKGSISNRNTKSAFQVLAPWNAKKNGEKNQVAVSTGGDNLNFKLMGAKMMSNYNDASNAWILDCSLVVLGNKIVDGSAIIQGNVEIDGTLEVKGKVTDLSDVDICGNLRVWGKVTDLSDVDICGNLNVKGESIFYEKLTNVDAHDSSGQGGIVTKYLTVTKEAYINLGSINHLVDVCDNVLTLGNHVEAVALEVRGIAAKYWAHSDVSNVAFFGMDPSFNGGLVDDHHGQFVFLIDVSNNVGTIDADLIKGTLGRAAFGTLDISGSSLYGDGGSIDGYQAGVPTQNVSGQANCQMHLVGKTIIAQRAGATAKLDISGGLNVEGDICGNGMNFAINYANVDISGSNTVDISGGTTNIDAGGTLSIGPVSQDITIGNGTFGTTVELLGNAVHISGETATLDATTALKIGPAATTIAIGNPNATVDISGSTVDISGGTHVKLIDGSGANINIANGLIHLDVINVLDTALGQIKLTDGSGAYIDMSGGKIDISGDDVTITSTSGTSLNLLGPKINIGTAGSTIDILGNVKVDTVTFVVTDISATNIDVSGALTVNGGTIDMSGTNTAVGHEALPVNTTGQDNVATGYQALYLNIDGSYNVATGSQALYKNISGWGNVATGYEALQDNTASGNTATGSSALQKNTTGQYNVATGSGALQNNISGTNNVATGYVALDYNIGSYNVAIGSRALFDNTDGSYNTAIGSQAGNGQTDISNTINIGYDASCNASNTACIGNANITDVYFGGTSGNAKLDCSGIVSSGLVETTDISCSSIYAGGTVGLNTQVLTSTGTGIEWVDGTTVGSHWNVDSDGIHNASGNVGIGKDSSNNFALDVSGNMAINGTLNVARLDNASDISNNLLRLSAYTTSLNEGPSMEFWVKQGGYQRVTAAIEGALIEHSGANFAGGNLVFSTTTTDGAILEEVMRLGPSSNSNNATARVVISKSVGIGVNIPFIPGHAGTDTLTVSGSSTFDGIYNMSTLHDTTESSGTTGQVLSSTGTGTEWVDGPSVGSHWTVDSSGIHNTSGNVGIGKDSSNNVALDVSGNMAVSGNLTVNGGTIKLDAHNTAWGYQALQDNISGEANTATGYQALKNNISGYNTATGAGALLSNIDGSGNVATGFQALFYNNSSFNSAFGYKALEQNIDSSWNVATGAYALQNNTGTGNVATGYQALQTNTIGQYNVATGYQALLQLDTVEGNTATGAFALQLNTDGSFNTATGFSALNATTGSHNTAIGAAALYANTIGQYNVAIGDNAGAGQTDISNTINIGTGTSCTTPNTACIGNADISCVYLGSTSGNAKLDCNGIVIGSQGITLDGSGNISPGNIGSSVTCNRSCGRIELYGSILNTAFNSVKLYSNKIFKSSSIILVNYCGVSNVLGFPLSTEITVDGQVDIYIKNLSGGTLSWNGTTLPGQIHFMIINPST